MNIQTHRRNFATFNRMVVFGVFVCLCAISIGIAQPANENLKTTDQRPNIVLIMVDDMGWSDLGCYGSEIQTPNIDRLATEGLLMTNFYNNGKCTTTRASLLTGLYPRNGGRGIELLTDEMLTLGEAMANFGYQTGLSGKWHNGSRYPHRPFDRGFQNSFGLWDGCCNFFDPAVPDPKFKGGRIRFFGQNDERIESFSDDFYTTDAFTDHAISTIQQQSKIGKPFFHYLAYTAPHYPLHAKPQDIAKYAGKYDDGWDTLRNERYKRQIEIGLIDQSRFPITGRNPDNQAYEVGRSDDIAWESSRMEVYAAMLDSVDQNIGRLMSCLDNLGIDDNTLVLFLSDNGACSETPGGANNTTHRPGPKEWYSHVGPNWAYAQNTPFRSYKSRTYEGGIATPMLVRWPAKIKAGRVSHQVGHIIDLMQTFVSVAEGEYPEERNRKSLLPLEGINLLPSLVQAKLVDRPEPLFWNWNRHRAVRDGKYKAVWENKRNGWELYDLSMDRTETKNIANDSPGVLQNLAQQWEAWANDTGVRF